MGSFRHQSYRDRNTDIDKDTASLKSMAERYDRGDRLGPQSPGIAGFTGRVKDRETAPHFNGSVARIGPAPRRTEGRETGRRKPGDEASDWRKNADPARERTEARESTRTGRERDSSRAAGDDTASERKRRDRSRAAEEDSRRWKDENGTGRPEKERKGREPSTVRDERETNRNGRKRGEEDERAEANRKRREERDKETPAWFEDDAPSGAAKGIVGARVGDELDELQKWKLEKKAKEEAKEREANAAANVASTAQDQDHGADTTSPPSEEHKTPRPAKNRGDLLPAPAPPLPQQTTDISGAASPLDQIKAMMGMTNGESQNHDDSITFGTSISNEPSAALPAFFTIPNDAPSRQPPSTATSNPTFVAQPLNEESRRTVEYDAPTKSRHAFAQPKAQPSPSPVDGMSFSSPMTGERAGIPGAPGLGAPPGLRQLQSVEPSQRTRNVSDASQQLPGQARNGPGVVLPLGINNATDPTFANRPMPPHMNIGGPLLHLPASAGANAGPRDGNVNVLSVVSPQPQAGAGPINAVGGQGMVPRVQTESPQQNLLARLGILGGGQDRKPSPKMAEPGYDRGMVPGDVRMPMPQQHYGAGPPGFGRDPYASPATDRFDPNEARYGMGHASTSSTSSSTFSPSPVAGNNPSMVLSAKGSRLAKFFDNPRGDDISPSAAMHGPGSNVMPPPGHQNRNGIVTPPQFDNSKNQGMPDLLALLQGAQPQGNQQPNRINNGMDPSMDLAMQRHRELALQQQQLREREARQLDPLYNQNADFYDSRGAFVANDLVPGLRPPIQRQERDLYNSDRLDERLNYAAHGRVPGVPGGYDQMMRNMSGGPAPRANPGMYPGMGNAPPGLAGHLAAEILQQQQLQQRERQRQQQQQRELERQQLLAMQANALNSRGLSGNIIPQLAPRQSPVDQYARSGGRAPINEIPVQQFGYNGLGGGALGNVPGNLGGLNGNAGYNGLNGVSNGFDSPLRQQQQQMNMPQRQLGMGYGGVGGIEARYAQQQAQLHATQGHNQGSGSSSDLMALLLAGNLGGQQN